MAIQLSTAVRNAMLDAYETTVGTSPKMRILTGAAPANCAAAQTGTLLAELTLPSDWAANAASGAKGLAGSWSGAVTVAGTAAHFPHRRQHRHDLPRARHDRYVRQRHQPDQHRTDRGPSPRDHSQDSDRR
jgi:hypothetical protein